MTVESSHFVGSRVIPSMDRERERQIVERLRAGDADAFDEVHAAFNARLFSFLARLTGRRDVAEDLLEEMWLRLVTHASRLRPDTRVGPWLFTVARHLHVSYRRARLVEDSHSAGLMGLWPSGVPGPTPFEAIEASESGRRVAAALAALPLAYREALLLVVVEGLRHGEAAAVCGVTPETMRQRVSRGRVLLARTLTEAETAGLVALKVAPV